GTGTGAGGASSDAPCAAECADDAGCDGTPPSPGGECAACIQGEVAQAAGSACTFEGATGACCSSDAGCTAFIGCVIGGGSFDSCTAENPAGGQKALYCILASC